MAAERDFPFRLNKLRFGELKMVPVNKDISVGLDYTVYEVYSFPKLCVYILISFVQYL